jgi:hypothetical protein
VDDFPALSCSTDRESGFRSASVYVHWRRGSLEYGEVYKPTSDRVAQASGMVSVQAACSVDEALVMIEERAQTIDLTAEEVAESVVDRRFRFAVRA